MFQNTANERFMKKNTKKYTPETTFTLEKALINICYKYFNSDLLDILEKEINLHKIALGLNIPDFLADFHNVYCSFGILKLKYLGVKIEDLDHFVKFCDPKYCEKIKILEKKNSRNETIDFNDCFSKFKAHVETQSESYYFSLDDFYRLNSKIMNFNLAKLAGLSSFRNNFERQMKKSLEQILNRKFTEAKSNLKELKKDEQYKNHLEIIFHINNLLILCHVELAEYFECEYYINLSIDQALANNLSYIYFYFLNLKFAIERIGFIEGPRSCIKFDFEDIKERKLILKDFIEMNQIDLSTQLRDCKLTTQISLAVVKDDIRELRNLESNKFLDIDNLFMNLKILSQEYSIISLYVIDDILHINSFDQILNTKINFKDVSIKLNAILAASKDILRRDVQSRKDKSDWWIDRLELEGRLQKLLKDIKIECKLTNDHVILILDEKSTNFPWEHTTFLKDKHVFRIPSLEY
ncbi:hypothetical protein NBO_1034g0001 [Nosema bombycis CQ1]|uniref:Uncharacterized protein n=1 Tax=Nosema bombycis (strain CQ1 / CVCC 102059) TaxID=578461 RepID=R0M0P1_NOSB1|nr:hypothetical protein NBO_1034g0001 [Nosema bombycis CQ1]|eukprot:EOB11594.1 hypothetical protein NBO_1034g0001 [Nosema bombycis CQ1]